MTSALLKLPLSGLLIAGGAASAQNLIFGSPVFSELYDSEGNTLDETFLFQLGAFINGFTPDSSNTGEWIANWQVFDAADYNGDQGPDDGIYGYFTSSSSMLPDGTSDSPHLTPGASSFEDLPAYLWIRNSDTTLPGSQWLLVRSEYWTFPVADPACCGNSLPTQWSVSDLASTDTPVWGSQNGIGGAGDYAYIGGHTLQTYTFTSVPVPEPASSIVLATSAGLLTLRRRRAHRPRPS